MEQPGGDIQRGYYSEPDNERTRKLRTLTHVLYALYAVHWLTGGVTGIIALIIGYLKRDDAAATRYEAHIRWQIRTFWMALGGYLVGAVLIVVAIGFAVIGLVSLWVLYRIVKGWLYLNDDKPLDPLAWF
jgi:uncharacterized membrane protein